METKFKASFLSLLSLVALSSRITYADTDARDWKSMPASLCQLAGSGKSRSDAVALNGYGELTSLKFSDLGVVCPIVRDIASKKNVRVNINIHHNFSYQHTTKCNIDTTNADKTASQSFAFQSTGKGNLSKTVVLNSNFVFGRMNLSCLLSRQVTLRGYSVHEDI